MSGLRVELHFHLLPGVDDGPATLAESLELASLAVADGTGTLVCTPHARAVEARAVAGLVVELQGHLDRAGIRLSLVPGAELAQEDVARMTDADLAAVAHGPPGRRWLLFEAPRRRSVEEFLGAATQLRDRGYGVLIGHPERCAALMASSSARDHLVGLGGGLQVNGSSLTGMHGVAPRRAALELVEAGLVTAIASDAHRRTHAPSLTAATAVLRAAGTPAATAERLVSEAPRRLLAEGIDATR